MKEQDILTSGRAFQRVERARVEALRWEGTEKREMARMIVAERGKGRTGRQVRADGGSWVGSTWALQLICVSDFPTPLP